MSYITGLEGQTIDALYDERGEVDCDGNNFDEPVSWREQARVFAIMAQERKEFLDKQRALLEEELSKL